MDELSIELEDVTLRGFLSVPKNVSGIVLFAHGSGSSRFSPRNQYVAKVLQDGGVATLLIDLLTPEEEEIDSVTRHLRFDIEMLAERVVSVVSWLEEELSTKNLKVGLFGSSTGAAAALIAAAKKGRNIGAVVSRGGRPDLASSYLYKVLCPTLLIVGEKDDVVIGMNEEALRLLPCEKKMILIPTATHLFEEPGTLEEVAHDALIWFREHLSC